VAATLGPDHPEFASWLRDNIKFLGGHLDESLKEERVGSGDLEQIVARMRLQMVELVKDHLELQAIVECLMPL
jgi:hypothetical protein